jgi:hypothetical protein
VSGTSIRILLSAKSEVIMIDYAPSLLFKSDSKPEATGAKVIDVIGHPEFEFLNVSISYIFDG